MRPIFHGWGLWAARNRRRMSESFAPCLFDVDIFSGRTLAGHLGGVMVDASNMVSSVKS